MLNTKALKDALKRFGARPNKSARRRQRALKNKHFTIISNDCWGAEVYKDFGLPYETPLIGTFLMGPCYMKLANDPVRILTSKLEFIEQSQYPEINARRQTAWYPVGRLADNVEIQFLHYTSKEDAADKWARRLTRSHLDRMFFKLSADKDRFTDADLDMFDKLPLRKIAFSKEPHPGLASVLTVSGYDVDGMLMYPISIEQFDIVKWLDR